MNDTEVFEQRDRLIFEHAHSNHTHSDNLRWSLAAGFGAFFYGGISVEQSITASTMPAWALQLALTLIGTGYFMILAIEGWYYNLYLKFLLECECRFQRGERLRTLEAYECGHRVPAFHPSWFFVLLMVTVANSYHCGKLISCWGGPVTIQIPIALAYVLIFSLLSAWGQMPRILSSTLTELSKTSFRGRATRLFKKKRKRPPAPEEPIEADGSAGGV